MKKLKEYLGRIVELRPEHFAALLRRKRLRRGMIENRFLVAATAAGKLVCYQAHLCLLFSPAEVVIV